MDPSGEIVRIHHDPMCPVCENGHGRECSCTCFCDFIADIREDERRTLGRVMGEAKVKEAAMSTAFADPNDHDPMCPRSDMEASWNGAECHCVVIRVLREVEGVSLERADYDGMWNKIEQQLRAEGNDT